MGLEFKLPEKCKMTMDQTMGFLIMMAVVTDFAKGQATFAVNDNGKAFNTSGEWVPVISVNVNAMVEDAHFQAGFDIFSDGVLDVQYAKKGGIKFQSTLCDLLEAEGAKIKGKMDVYLAYVCDGCSLEWEQIHSCYCNDRCPECNQETEPVESYGVEG